MDLFQKCLLFTEAKKVMALGYYPFFIPIQKKDGSEVIIDGKPVIMVGSNDYLGLSSHPLMKEASIRAIHSYGTSCNGSRFFNGTLDLHVELEERLADFLHKETALVFSTGFQTNLGIISTLVGKNDVIIIDKEDHASIVEGSRLSLGKLRRFSHNDLEELEEILRTENPVGGKFVAIDGVFSMEGDIVPLPEIVSLCKKFNARIMVDDAHATGILGDGGRGTASRFDLEKEIDLIMGTFSKSFASLGGFVTGDEHVIHYLKHHARSLIFSASMPPANVASVLTALDIIRDEEWRIRKLWENTERMHREFKELGFNTGCSQTPVIPIIIGNNLLTFQMARLLLEEGVFVNPVVSPAVPQKRALIRTSYMATHTDEQLDRVIEAFKKVKDKLEIPDMVDSETEAVS
jgi:8-amino-7-oxononanoate synthase